jgi:uncharacterized repeat protein (TIGR01451 family)
VTKALSTDRVNPGDQFTMEIRLGSANGPVVSDQATATTAGAGSTVVAGTGTTGAFLADTGVTYVVTEAGAGSTVLGQYGRTVTCIDSTGIQGGLPTNADATNGVAITPQLGTDISCTLSNRALGLDKQVTGVVDVNGNGVTDAGDTIDYEFDVTNTGTVTLHDPSVDDPMVGAVTCPQGALAPVVTVTCTADTPYTITQADVDSPTGAVINTATAAADDPSGNTIASEEDTAETPVDQRSGLTLKKRGVEVIDVNDDGTTDAGDTIRWAFDLTNTGTVTLSDLNVNDPMLADRGILIVCPGSELAPGATQTCGTDGVYAITEADEAAATVVNTATATATAAGLDERVLSPAGTTRTPIGVEPEAPEALPGTGAGAQLGIVLGGLALVLGGLTILSATRRRERKAIRP